MRVVILSVLLVAGCGFPKSRHCFSSEPVGEPEVPEPAAAANPPAEVAGVAELVAVARGLERPIALAQPPGDHDRLFIAEQGGRIVIVRDGEIDPAPFADLSQLVARDDREQGLLGIAFHPKYDEVARLYVNYTAREDGATHVVELRAHPDDPDRLDPAGPREVLRIGQPWRDNNGGHVVFGPDWKLYVGMGDGGGRVDPRGHAQRCASWRGKMLRIDVDADPPVVSVIQVGLQNPWRYSFDRETHEMYVTDVGSVGWESLYILRATNIERHNFGWPIVEGGRCVRGSDCNRRGFTAPVFVYSRSTGCGITGGYVYRGRALPALDGLYFFTDQCSDALRSVRWKYGRATDPWDWTPALDPRRRIARVASFGQDNAGELYLLSLDGVVYKLVPRQAPAP